MKLYLLTCAIWAVFANVACADDVSLSVENDVPFGGLPRQVMDIYSPASVHPKTAVLVFYYGGGFTRGSKASIQRTAKSLSRSGMIVVAPNYRLYPEATFPTFVEDAALAVSYVWQNLRNEEGLPRPIFTGGWSAGAYISALVAYDGRYLEATNAPPSAINGFIGFAGPYKGGICAGQSCPHIFPAETKSDWAVARFVDADDPPMLLVRGTHDQFVDKANLENLAAMGKAAGVGTTTLVVKGAHHEDLLTEMEESGTSVRTAVDTFVQRVLAEIE